MDWFRSRQDQWRTQADEILRHAAQLRDRSDEDLSRNALELKWQVRAVTPLSQVITAVYALCTEAARRTLEFSLYPAQIVGALGLIEERVVEMQTGEGKTITAVLPVALRAMAGKGCHVVTANEYLAKRDADTMRPLYRRLNLSCGCVQPGMSDDERREQYARDVTYLTGSEAGFDFLRDRLRFGADAHHPRRRLFQSTRGVSPVQRGHFFALIDEADSILIDAARTPLIIGLEEPEEAATVAMYHWAHESVQQLTLNDDFVFETKQRLAWLTERGCHRLTLLGKPRSLDTIYTEQLYDQVERSLVANYGLVRDLDYIVVDDQVRLVSEGTGRQLPSQKWQDGLHQAVEVKENIPVTSQSKIAARVTIQSYFSQYQHLAGMTGTAVQAEKEFKRYYRLNVSVISTHRPCIRQGHRSRIFIDQESKRAAIVREVRRLTSSGRAVLIGTPSVRASLELSASFNEVGIEHSLLNAVHHGHEAAIVAQAGQPGCVTIATNMAGRGTDILLHDDVRQNGGLHVIATELHTSKRIDRQLIGRAARQGDPGSYQFFLSLEDELLTSLGKISVQKLKLKAHPNADGELNRSWFRVLLQMQWRTERAQTLQRRRLYNHEQARLKRLHVAGFDPFLECLD